MHVMAVANQKGGVGKTTTTVNLGACLARAGRRVLLIDLDQQTNTTQHLGQTVPANAQATSYALLVEQRPAVENLLLPVGPNLALAPGHIALAEVDLRLAAAVNPDGRLKRALTQVADKFDYCLIDCPPSLGRATINAMVAATQLLVVIETAWFAYEAIQRLSAILEEVVEQANPELEIYALATLHRPQVKMHNQVLERVRQGFQQFAFQTVIRHTVAFVEAAAAGQSIVDYAHGSRGHQDYQQLAQEVIANVEKAQAPNTALASRSSD